MATYPRSIRKPSERCWKMMADEQLAALSIPELFELIARISEELELRIMELAGEEK